MALIWFHSKRRFELANLPFVKNSSSFLIRHGENFEPARKSVDPREVIHVVFCVRHNDDIDTYVLETTRRRSKVTHWRIYIPVNFLALTLDVSFHRRQVFWITCMNHVKSSSPERGWNVQKTSSNRWFGAPLFLVSARPLKKVSFAVYAVPRRSFHCGMDY